MTEIYDVTKSYRARQRLSLRGFADELNHDLVNTNVTYATVSRWEQGVNYYEPDMRLLFECLAVYQDWRSRWAADCLRAMWPDLFLNGIVRVELPMALPKAE